MSAHWYSLACRWGKRKSGKMASIYLYLTDAETDAQWASNLHRCLVMTAMQLAWCKHLTSQTLTAQDAVKMLPEKILVSCVDSFCEANHTPPPHLGRADLNLPKCIVASVKCWEVSDLCHITQPCMSAAVLVFMWDYLQFKRLPVPFCKLSNSISK